jgi:hypothetical protein
VTYTNARCTVESDGYHLHEYQSGIAVVTEHRHAWINEHLARYPWPASSRVYIGAHPFAGTVEQAWAKVTGGELPTVECEEAA